jgi:hypothetical protein
VIFYFRGVERMPKIDLPPNDPILTAKNNRYVFLYTKPDKTSAENIELAGLQIELEPYIIRAADWNGLFISVSDGKNAVATAITGKGVPASGGDTFTQLASKVGSINTGTDTSDATATPSDILASKTAYAGGKITGTLALTGNATSAQVLSGRTYYDTDAKTKRTGIMPDRAGDTAAIASSVSGTTLKLRPSNGYRDGVDDNVTITDADFIAANIASDKNIFGLTGTLDVGKRFASGSAVSGGSTTLTDESGGPISGALVTVAGLTFTPRLIYIVTNTPPVYLKVSTMVNMSAPQYNGYSMANVMATGSYRIGVSGVSVVSGGFSLPVQMSGVSHMWWAVE